ncbi:MAG: hypothetical protein P8J89_07005, partial [Phycisphaerales bacterium]|nr:hypothetical protein [Phycisphaerales bacterium]
SDMPDEMTKRVLSDRLAQVLLEPGTRLPLDPLPDDGYRDMVHYMTQRLIESSPLNQYDEALIMEAYRRIDEPLKSLDWSERILKRNPDLATAMFSRAESLLKLPDSDHGEAIGLYTRLSKMDPADEHNLFWTSQVRLLQLMLEDGRSMDAIEARLNRLQRKYPDLGGTPYIGEFAIVRSGLKDAILP